MPVWYSKYSEVKFSLASYYELTRTTALVSVLHPVFFLLLMRTSAASQTPALVYIFVCVCDVRVCIPLGARQCNGEGCRQSE